jgi:hypothetical protein
MSGITIGETNNCSNPLIQFFHQINGIMVDLYALSFTIKNVNTGSTLVPATVVDLDDCSSGGAKLSTGRYVAIFTTESTWKDGTCEIIWTYTSVLGGDAKTWSQKFEVLKASTFARGRGYKSFISSLELQHSAALKGCEIPQIQIAARDAASLIETYTGRLFEPTYIDARYNGRGCAALPLDEPIIGISEINVYTGNDVSSEVDLDSVIVYNRHITAGLNEPDDRDNPRLEMVNSSALNNSYVDSIFPLGRQNIQIAGVFGYTEFDGSCIGSVPRALVRLAGILSYRLIMDPFGIDVSISQPGRIKSAKTRDQSVTFADASSGGVGQITGDRTVDDLILMFMKPPQFHAVPENNRV